MAKKLGAGFLTFHWFTTLLVFIGALTWGILAINPDFNLIEYLSFGVTWIPRVIYGLVGLAGISLIPSIIYLTMRR